MELQIANIRMSVTKPESTVKTFVLNKFHINGNDVEDFRILRSSIDARKKSNVEFDYRVYLKLKNNNEALLRHPDITLYNAPEPMRYGQWSHQLRPVVVGFGPAGMFAALYLARCQARPIVLERGSQMEQRKQDVNNFLTNKVLNPDSNVQFGEGGAGTFSDGKLTTNLHNAYIGFVLEEFYKHGATIDVTYAQNPHVGTDYLEKVVTNIRKEIISLGGEFHFNTRFTDFNTAKDGTISVFCNNNKTFSTNHLLLCFGHSARDTIRHLYQKGMQMEAKPFSMGVRVEHLQSRINTMQYGTFAKHLPAASYKGVVHLKERSVYTFCMCPGGTVMASTSEPGSIVTNGMSEKNRDKANANSALLVGVEPADFFKESPLDGLAYQEKYEKLAFDVAGDYRAPANLMKEFLQGKIADTHRNVKPSYPHGVIYCDLNKCLPPYVVKSLREAIPLFDRKLHGFSDPDAVLTGIETRSSSPIRILRDEARQSNLRGIYPVGEGAGYAGGITSAAIDGLKTAMAICETVEATDHGRIGINH